MEIFKKKFLISWIFFLTIPFFTFSQKKENIPVVKLFEKEYYKYEVKKRATVFSICKNFQVTEAELISMNPFIVDGLKAGQTLLIPVKAKEDNDTDKKAKIDENKGATLFIGENSSVLIPHKIPRITLLLPFSPTETPGVNERYVEFYEGFLLAVDSLKSLGLSFEVQAINSGNDAESIDKIIKSGELNETDYCIGGASAEQISTLSTWASANQKNLILPFSSRIPEMENNPYLFQTNTTYSHMYKRLSEFAAIRFVGYKVIFLNSKESSENEESALATYLKSQFEKKGISYNEVSEDDELKLLTGSLSKDRENLVIPSNMSLNDATRFITRLSAIASKDTTRSITLFGYPEWQAMNKRYIQRLHQLNTFIFSNFFANFQDKNVRDFQLAFNKTFSKELLNTYPKYGIMGYDVASSFIPRMVYEKSSKPMINGPEPIQNEFQFKALEPGSGAFNQVFYIINYKPGNSVEIKQLK